MRTIIRVLLSKMIRQAFTVTKTYSIMICTRATSAIRGLCIMTRVVRLSVRLKDFTRNHLGTTCLHGLTSSIRISRFGTVLRTLIFRRVGHLRRFTKDRTRLANVTSTFFPLPTTKEDRFSTSTRIKACIRLANRFVGNIRFIRFFRGRRSTFTRLLNRRYRLSVIAIFVSITSGKKVEINISNSSHVGFQFKAHFGTWIRLFTITSSFLCCKTCLICLGKVSGRIFAFMIVFFNHLIGAFTNLFSAIIRSVERTCRCKDQRVASNRFIGRFTGVGPCAILAQNCMGVSLFISAGMVSSPAVSIMGFFKIFGAPFSRSGFLWDLGVRRTCKRDPLSCHGCRMISRRGYI